MGSHGSATAHSEAPHADQTIRTNTIEALVEIICGAGGEAPAALLVLMATLQSSAEPKALANTAKHVAFTRCGELNLFGMVDAQVEVVASQLLAGNTLT